MHKIALTIDVEQDVPPYLNTWRGMEKGLPLLLELLANHDIRATFFITGEAAKKFPGLISRISKEHEVGCHGYKHERFDKLSAKEHFPRIEAATKILTKIVKRRVLGFRAPNFRPSIHTFAALKRLNYLYDASNACYRAGPDPKPYGLIEIPNTWPSSLLRLPPGFSTRVLRLCSTALPLTVLDYHPWEFVEMKNIRFDCRFATGEVALQRLDKVLEYLLKKKRRFVLMRDVAKGRGGQP